MKKLLICSICSLSALVLVGCSGSGSSATVKDLNNQLDRASSSINLLKEQDLSSIANSTIVKNSTQDGSDFNNNFTYLSYSLYNLQGKVSNDITIQKNLAEQISNKISKIQACLKNNKTKYKKNQSKALKQLTSQVSMYASKIKNSKNDINEGMKLINYNRKVTHMSLDGIGTGYNSVSNALEMRKAYYYNLLNTLSQIESIVCNGQDTEIETPTENNDEELISPQSANEEQNISRISEQTEDSEKPEAKPEKKFPRKRRNLNIPDNFNEKPENTNVQPQVIDNTAEYYNNPNVMNNPYYNGYNGGGYYYQNMTNPGRNTDTYRPWKVNIDTYRINPNGNGLYNNAYYRNGYNNANVPNTVVPASTQDDDLEVKENAIQSSSKPSNSEKLMEQIKGVKKIKNFKHA